MYHGIILDVEFNDHSFPQKFRVFAKRKSTTNPWILYGIEIPQEEINKTIFEIKKNLKKDEPYCAHFYSDKELIVVFKEKTFRVKPHISTWKPILEFGRQLKIPEDQLDFWPNRFQDEKQYFRQKNSVSHTIPISVKAILLQNNKIWLRQNERHEWELPGGKLEPNEQPEQTLKRELQEELGMETEIINLIQAHNYKIQNSLDESNGVLILIYICKLRKKTGKPEIQSEAGRAKFQQFSLEEMKKLNMPEFYKEAIYKASKLFYKPARIQNS